MYRWGFAALVLVACGPSVGASSAGESSSESGLDGSTTTVISADGSATIASTGTSTTLTTAVDTTFAESSEGDSSGLAFITTPDVPGHCGYCEVWAQDCPERTKCSPYACVSEDEERQWDAAGCFPLDPSPAQPGESCVTEEHAFSGRDDCEISSMCWDVDPETLTGVCAPLCMGNEDNPVCEDGDRSCYFGDNDILTVCLPQCDPLAPACADDETCVWNQRGALDFVCVPQQHVPALAYGDDCSDDDGFGCGDALVCQSAGEVPGCAGKRCCTMLGDVTAAPVCPDVTQTCEPLYADGEAPAGLENLCACRVAE